MSPIKKLTYFLLTVTSTVLICSAAPTYAKKLEIIIGGKNFCKTDEDCKGNTKCHNGSHICVECQTPPFIWNGTSCVCPKDTIRTDDNDCVQCLSDKDCADNEGTPYCNTETNTCFSCLNTYERDNNECVCPASTHELGNFCVCNNENAELNDDGFCQCILNKNSCTNSDFTGNSDCNCCPADKPIWNGLTCNACPEKMPVYENGRCVCQEDLNCAGNETCYGGACIACPSGQIRSETEVSCHCPADKPVWDGKNCVICTAEKGCEGNTPVCNVEKQICEACPTSTPVWNATTKVCEICPDTAPNWNVTTKVCEACPTTTPVWNATTKVCEICPDTAPNWNVTTKVCEACPTSTPVWNATTKVCEICPDTAPNWKDRKSVV